MTKSPFRKRLGRAFRSGWKEITGRVTRSAYDGADVNRLLLDWIAQARTADEEIRGDIQMLRSRARELARNNSYAKRYFRLLINNVVGPTGIRLQGRVRTGDVLDKATNTAIETGWKEWAEGPVSVAGKLTLRQFENLLVKTLACDGEVLVRYYRGHPVNRYGLALQFIDADMLDHRFNRPRRGSQNEIRMGVEIDEYGTPVGYWVWDQPTSVRTSLTRKRQRIDAGDLRHIYMQDRPNQTRGVTWVHSVMVPAHMLDAYEQSEAVAARIGAAKMGFFQKLPEAMTGGIADNAKVPARMDAAPGSLEVVADGYEFKGWDPDHPTSQFGPFVKQMLRKIASGFSVFYNVLANDAEGVTYSTMRSFALIERDDWRGIQQDVTDMWRRPLYREWLSMSLLTGALTLGTRNPNHYLAVRHVPRGWAWIDPEKEAKAANLSIGNGLNTRTAILAERGEDIEEVFRTLGDEIALAKKYGITLSSDTPPDVTKTKEEWDAEAEEDEDGTGGENGTDRSETRLGNETVTGFVT